MLEVFRESFRSVETFSAKTELPEIYRTLRLICIYRFYARQLLLGELAKRAFERFPVNLLLVQCREYDSRFVGAVPVRIGKCRNDVNRVRVDVFQVENVANDAFVA